MPDGKRRLQALLGLDELNSAPLSELRRLPNTPGVYLAVGANWEPLYAGKATVSLRRRWASHHRRGQILKLNGARVVWIEAPACYVNEMERGIILVTRTALNGRRREPFGPVGPAAPEWMFKTIGWGDENAA